MSIISDLLNLFRSHAFRGACAPSWLFLLAAFRHVIHLRITMPRSLTTNESKSRNTLVSHRVHAARVHDVAICCLHNEQYAELLAGVPPFHRSNLSLSLLRLSVFFSEPTYRVTYRVYVCGNRFSHVSLMNAA